MLPNTNILLIDHDLRFRCVTLRLQYTLVFTPPKQKALPFHHHLSREQNTMAISKVQLKGQKNLEGSINLSYLHLC